MIYTCDVCGRPIRPRDQVPGSGNPDAVSHGPCQRCFDVTMRLLDSKGPYTIAQVRELSLRSIPACQRVGRL